MAERKIAIYYESGPSVNEDDLMEYVHKFFCENPDDKNTEDCPLYAITFQDIVEEEGQ